MSRSGQRRSLGGSRWLARGRSVPGAIQFRRRFLLHIVPDGFVRIRHVGLLANRQRAVTLAQCRALLAQPPPPAPEPPESVRALMLRVTGLDIERGPVCQQGQLRRLDWLPPTSSAWDTS